MNYVLTDARGMRIGTTHTDRASVRSAGRAYIKATGGAVMVWFADVNGNQTGYSDKDTDAVTRAVNGLRSRTCIK